MRVKVLIMAHKPIKNLNIPYHNILCVGAYRNYKEQMWKISGECLRDNYGINISEKNDIYNELTGQYWMWKNIGSSYDYVGLCHYRRYFSFKSKIMDKPRVSEPFLTDNVKRKYGWDVKQIEQTVQHYDTLWAAPESDVKPGVNSIYENHIIDGELSKSFQILLNCINYKYPNYNDAAKKYFSGTAKHMFNMFIMRKSLFDNYSFWLFDILFTYEEELRKQNVELTRACGFAGEHLLNIWVYYQCEHSHIRIRELKTVMFQETNEFPTIKQKIKAIIKHDFTYLFPYGSKRRDIVKWKYFMN